VEIGCARFSFDLAVSETPIEGGGKDLLVSVSLTGDAANDVRRLLTEGPRFKLWLDVKVAAGAGSTSVNSAGEATAIAVQVKKLMRQLRIRSAAERIGWILYSPASVELFVGQRLNALGEVIAYERRIAGGYQEAVIIQTG
jgi:hypothetical protein